MFPGAIAQEAPDRPAVIMATTGQVITFAQLDAAANRLSHVLREAGLVAGDHIAFCLKIIRATSRFYGDATMQDSSIQRALRDSPPMS